MEFYYIDSQTLTFGYISFILRKTKGYNRAINFILFLMFEFYIMCKFIKNFRQCKRIINNGN